MYHDLCFLRINCTIHRSFDAISRGSVVSNLHLVGMAGSEMMNQVELRARIVRGEMARKFGKFTTGIGRANEGARDGTGNERA